MARDLEASVRRKYADAREVAAFQSAAGLSAFETELLVRAFRRGDRVLDVGCGAGREAIAMASQGLRVVAIDLVPTMTAAAVAHASTRGLALPAVTADAAALPLRERTFDGVAMLGQVIAHLPSRPARMAALEAAWRTLRPGGRLALTTHNHRCHWKFRLYFAGLNPVRRLARRLGMDALGNHDRWSRRISEAGTPAPVFFHMYDCAEALADLASAGFEVEAVTGSGRAPDGTRDYFLGFVACRPAGARAPR